MPHEVFQDDPGCCALAPHTQSEKIDRKLILSRRSKRLFGNGGLVERFEQIDNELWKASKIAERMADAVPGGYQAVIGRFKLSVKAERPGRKNTGAGDRTRMAPRSP